MHNKYEANDKEPVIGREVEYKDYTHLPETWRFDDEEWKATFPEIFNEYIKNVRSKMFGKDVRESIVRLAQITFQYAKDTIDKDNNKNKEDFEKLKTDLNNIFEAFKKSVNAYLIDYFTKLSSDNDKWKTDTENKFTSDFKVYKDEINNAISNVQKQMDDFIVNNDKKLMEVLNKFKEDIGKINANVELVNAREGKESLKDNLQDIKNRDFLKIDGTYYDKLPSTKTINELGNPLSAFIAKNENEENDYVPHDDTFTGLSMRSGGENFFTLFSREFKCSDFNTSSSGAIDIWKFIRLYTGSVACVKTPEGTTKINTYAQVKLEPAWEYVSWEPLTLGTNDTYEKSKWVDLPDYEIGYVRIELENGEIYTRKIITQDPDVKKHDFSIIYWMAREDNTLNAGWGGDFKNYAPFWGAMKFRIVKNEGKQKLRLWFVNGDVRLYIHRIEVSRKPKEIRSINEKVEIF